MKANLEQALDPNGIALTLSSGDVEILQGLDQGLWPSCECQGQSSHRPNLDVQHWRNEGGFPREQVTEGELEPVVPRPLILVEDLSARDPKVESS